MEQLENKVEIIQCECLLGGAWMRYSTCFTVLTIGALHAVNEQTGRFQCDHKLTFSHLYPPTKIMFFPDKECNHPDILATSGDYLRLWKIGEESVTLHKMLNNVRPPPPPPLMAYSAEPASEQEREREREREREDERERG